MTSKSLSPDTRPSNSRLTSSSSLLRRSEDGSIPAKPIAERPVGKVHGMEAFRLGSSFFLFGIFIAMQFSVVVAAAGDLVGDRAPKAAVLTAYTLPSVTVRLLVPFATFPSVSRLPFLGRVFARVKQSTTRRKLGEEEEEVNYPMRIGIAAACSFVGLNLLAWAGSLWIRLIGIALASCSSNLGDLTCYQMATRYPSTTLSVGLYTSGGGAAGLVGALTYTVLTQLGASPSAVISGTGLVPMVVILTYIFWLPSYPRGRPSSPMTEGAKRSGRKALMIKDLGTADRLSLAFPMIQGYMAPLCILFLVEITDVQGILSTIIFYIPFQPPGWRNNLLNHMFPTKRSFYPVYQTVYQLAAFLGRTSVTFFRLPGGPKRDPRALWALIGMEIIVLFSQLRESMSMVGKEDSLTAYGPLIVLALVLVMGMCGGATLGNVYYRIGKWGLPSGVGEALQKARKRRRLAALEYQSLPGEDEDGDGDEDDEEETDEDGTVPIGPHRPVKLRRNPSERSLSGTAAHEAALSNEDEAALREFVISSIGAADTLAILTASVIAMVLEPTLCRRQVDTGRMLCLSK